MTARPVPLVPCVVGPTAAGKTAVAVLLARRFPCEIISVDSAMIYRGMDIGTAKPGRDVLDAAPHHLIDIRDPWESYSAGQFCADARDLIEDISRRGRIPLLVGGTFLYFRALEHGLAPLPAGDTVVRAELDRRAASDGWPALHAELAALDPEAARRIGPMDRQRLQRALEVIELTGEPISALQRMPGEALGVRFLRVALAPGDRSVLHARIERRFHQMITAGFIEEVERLRQLPQMSAQCPSMRAVGYRQVWAHLEGELSRDEAVRRGIVATRRLAKRQLTWMRSQPAALQFDCLLPDLADRIVDALAIHLGPPGASSAADMM